MTSDERIDSLARSVTETERLMRQGFQVLTGLHADTERALQRMENGLSQLLSIAADYEHRIRKLEE